MNGLFDISGKTALVTGGSRGIGLMIARGLLEAGAHVIVCSRKVADLEATARELAAIGDCHAIQGDVSTPEGATPPTANRRSAWRSGPAPASRAGAHDQRISTPPNR